jgi:hypothetical protein
MALQLPSYQVNGAIQNWIEIYHEFLRMYLGPKSLIYPQQYWDNHPEAHRHETSGIFTMDASAVFCERKYMLAEWLAEPGKK